MKSIRGAQTPAYQRIFSSITKAGLDTQHVMSMKYGMRGHRIFPLTYSSLCLTAIVIFFTTG